MIGIVARIALVIFIVELAAMLLFDFLDVDLSSLSMALADASFLTVGSVPVIYRWIIKPFVLARQESDRQLREINMNLEQRVSMRTRELALAKDEAELANHYKSEFLSRMSHELRTPMNAILGFAQLLQKQFAQDAEDKRGKQVNEILLASNQLLTMIDEILDLSQIDTGRKQLRLQDLSCRTLLKTSIDFVRPLLEKKKLRLDQAEASVLDIQIHADANLCDDVLRTVFAVIIDLLNAGGCISVSLQVVEDGFARIDIIASGEGLGPVESDLLFVPFERLDTENSQHTGTGIGLSISRKKMELMGGRIYSAAQNGLGAGLSLDFRLAKGLPRFRA